MKQGYRKLFRFGLNWAIILTGVLIFAYLLLNANLYNFAENRIETVLQQNDDLESHLLSYGDIAQQWRDKLHPVMGIARFVDNVSKLIKDFGLWEDILNAAGKSTPGGRFMLDQIVKISHELVVLDDALEKITVSLIAQPDFQTLRNPDIYLGKEGLSTAYGNTKDISDGLNTVSQKIERISSYISEITDLDQMSSLLTLLDKYRIQTPSQASLPNDLYDGIQAWKALPQTLDTINNQINADVNTLNRVRNWYYVAYYGDKALNYFYLRNLLQWIVDRRLMILAIISILIAVSIGSFIGMVGLNEIQWRARKRPKYIVQNNPQSPPPTPRRTQPKAPVERVQNAPTTVNVINIQNDLEGPSIICAWSDGRTRKMALPMEGKITVGCGLSDELKTDRKLSSPSQVMIKKGRTRFFVEILANTFPTALNGSPIASARSLKNGDVIQVGDSSIVFLENM